MFSARIDSSTVPGNLCLTTLVNQVQLTTWNLHLKHFYASPYFNPRLQTQRRLRPLLEIDTPDLRRRGLRKRLMWCRMLIASLFSASNRVRPAISLIGSLSFSLWGCKGCFAFPVLVFHVTRILVPENLLRYLRN